MKRTKGYYLRTWKNIGSTVIISGAIVACLINNGVGGIVALIGILINVSSCLIGKLVYICPECKTQFRKDKNKITFQTSRWTTHWALLVCPKCKKKNWCKTKLVSREEI